MKEGKDMILNIALTELKEPKNFSQRLTARVCRETYEAWDKYTTTLKGTRDGDVIPTQKSFDCLVDWLISVFNGQFTKEEFWDGYGGSPMELPIMMKGIVTALSTAVLELPLKEPTEETMA